MTNDEQTHYIVSGITIIICFILMVMIKKWL